MPTALQILEIAGVFSLISGIVIAYMYLKLKEAERKRKLASKFQQELTANERPSDAAIRSLAILYGVPRRKIH
jgi:hypothetical protein